MSISCSTSARSTAPPRGNRHNIRRITGTANPAATVPHGSPSRCARATTSRQIRVRAAGSVAGCANAARTRSTDNTSPAPSSPTTTSAGNDTRQPARASDKNARSNSSNGEKNLFPA